MIAVQLPPLGQIPPLDVWVALGALAVAATPAAVWVAGNLRRLRLEVSRLRGELGEARAEVVHLNATLAATREALVLARENVRLVQSADVLSGLLHTELTAMRQDVRRLAAESPPPSPPPRAAGGAGCTPTPH
jgi:hypothetical protein